MVRVEVHFADGAREAETVEAPRGSEQKFANETDVTDKFRKLARAVMTEAQADRIGDMVLRCERLPNIGAVVAALVADGGRKGLQS